MQANRTMNGITTRRGIPLRWKAQVKERHQRVHKKALSYEEFLRLMKDNGYEINGETFGEGSAKYISFRPYGKDRFVRGRANTLGANYTKERILERIEEKTNPDISTDFSHLKSCRTLSIYSINTYAGFSGLKESFFLS